jgi:hypothetical protein
MHIVIDGTNPRITDAVVVSAVEFYADYLLTDREYRDMDIYINFEKGLRKNIGDAECCNETDSGPAREFTISLDAGMGKRRTLIALAHEMVHVKQYARGEMRYIKTRRQVKFKKQYFAADYFYFERPWEIEAFGRELGLYEMYRTRGNK